MSRVDISSVKEPESFMRELSALAFYLITQTFMNEFVIFLLYSFKLLWAKPPPTPDQIHMWKYQPKNLNMALYLETGP